MSKIFNWTLGSFCRTLGRFLFYIALGALSFLAFSWFKTVDAATIYNVNVTAKGNSSTMNSYVNLYNADGPTGNFAYGTYSFIYFNNIQMGVPEKDAGDKYSYILGVQVCQTSSYISLYYDGGSIHNQINYIDFLGGYKTNSNCYVNGYNVKKVNYYFEVNGTLTSNGDTAFTNQYFVLRFSDNYNEFNITKINFSEYSEELVTEIKNNTSTNELINKQEITNNKLDQQISQNQTIIDQNNQTSDTLTSEDSDTTSSKCGVVCKLKGIFTGIAELPSKLVTLLIDALKSLFVPTEGELQSIIDSSSELAENFGFVGETIDFFIDMFTSFLGMVNGNGCITMPKFEIGATTLFDSHVFWEEQRVCLADNVILADNIDTIRTITSISLVCLFLGFASRQFFKILSKSESESDS